MSNFTVPVGISNRHIHVSDDDLITLFGEGATLTIKKDLSQKGQYLSLIHIFTLTSDVI